ncbi:MAG: hypothetical protein LQ342_004593 [Letrouitia transgressa]|nr:MAG: hypothetical protein LQ342_004593 [Letrouitia transgressa]
MHFALPPRKTSNPPPYARASRTSSLRRRQLQFGAIIGCALLVLIFLISHLFGRGAERIPPGTPEVVIMTLMDEENMSKEYINKIKENRKDYAARHGYTTFFPSVSDYNIGSSPRSWALIPAVRHALTDYPHTPFIFALSPHALIMNPSLNLQTHLLSPKKLEYLMLRDKPVVPPDSVIKTFSHLHGDRIDLILTQDAEGLSQGSFFIRKGDWAEFFLDTWFDPLYRSYNFQKAEGHALEHIVQWHPTILTKLALVPQRVINSYGVEIASRGGKEVMYKDGDLVVRLVGCEGDPNRSCEKEFDVFYNQWKRTVGKEV